MNYKKIEWANKYELSDIGDVREEDTKNKIPFYYSNGYKNVNLRSNEGKIKSKPIHRLVAEAFIPNPKGKKTVNHKNMIKSDNSVQNLEWMTFSENSKHYAKNKHLKSDDKEFIEYEKKEYVNWRNSVMKGRKQKNKKQVSVGLEYDEIKIVKKLAEARNVSMSTQLRDLILIQINLDRYRSENPKEYYGDLPKTFEEYSNK